jgi:hypothetical protein
MQTPRGAVDGTITAGVVGPGNPDALHRHL